METVVVMVRDEHPLIQLGLLDPLFLVEGVAIRVVGVTGRPSRRRLLSSRNRRALRLITRGGGIAELADRLRLPLERAEAIHEELIRMLGLDRIVSQVRAAFGARMLGDGEMLLRRPEARDLHPSEVSSTPERTMTDLDLVRVFFPDAEARRRDGGWEIVSDPQHRSHRLGEGATEAEAWSSAVLRLWKDDWFRPLIVQIRSMAAEDQGGA
ncbi:immunoglobulin domain-containing family protein [Tautonia sociabilis]|uniref:Uncharacterized protein n=1 Tax=Tautonia sociabilis TaxID=2080755 RepID=A0A432MJ00_9BACT|nr:hypothetical protein [Tautonia sociabilis]RUL87342.1 hypothetical protein TsocGM_12470 [Tautonia sociabilis]